MTSLTKALLGRLKLKARNAEDELIAIAKREAANNATDDDAANLENALSTTGKSAENYEQTVALLKQIMQLKGEAAKLPAVSAAYVKAREAIAAHQAETKQIEKARREGQLQLELARNVEYSKHDKAHKAQCAVERLECAHPELFDGKEIDLDSLLLTSGDGSNIINCRDDDAPFREVPETTWHEESTRRQQIRGAATAQARAEYNDKAEKWAEKQPKNYLGQIVSDETFPRFEAPTWGEIVAQGLNVKLDWLPV